MGTLLCRSKNKLVIGGLGLWLWSLINCVFTITHFLRVNGSGNIMVYKG